MATKIFVTNLGKYNEGELIGKWVTLPITSDELDEVLEEIGINEQYEEVFITDSETDIEGFEIGEYDGIEELSDMVEEYENLDESQRICVQAMLEEGYTFEDAMDRYENCIIYYDCNDMEDVAYRYIEETGMLYGIPENIANYFDYEAFGRDMSFEGQFVFIGNDCVQIL